MALGEVVDSFGILEENYKKVQECFKAFVSELDMSKVVVNSHFSPFVLSLSFSGVNGETLVHMMEQKDILIGRGSACSSRKVGNRVLENMGLNSEQIVGSVRISFSKFTEVEQARFAGRILMECYNELKEKLK